MSIRTKTPDKKYSPADLKSHKGFKDGKLYEKLILTFLAKKGYELSKCNPGYTQFSIGKEISAGKEGKFDDIIFKYEDQYKSKHLIYVQIKHKQDVYKIDSQILSAEASTAKGGRGGGMRRDFNLQKYFISYLNDREQLKSTTCEELKNGKIKHVALFTNVGADTADLISNGFSLGEAPDDIQNLFDLKVLPSRRTQDYAWCFQLKNISEDLHKILQKSSDLHRIARVLAEYVVWETYREKKILKTDETPIKYYHGMLGKHVIEKCNQVINIPTANNKKILYCDAKFKDDFIDNTEKGSKQELLIAIFKEVRDLDTSKRNVSDEELKNILKGVEFKVVPHFGKSESDKKDLPDKWTTVNDDDINDFLKCLVFFVNQPNSTDLLTHICSEKDSLLVGTRLGEALDNINPKFRDRLEKHLGIYEEDSYKPLWLSDKEVSQFAQEVQEAVIVSVKTLMYEDEILQYGRFSTLGKLTPTLDTFLKDENSEEITEHPHLLRKVLCIRTPMTLLSTIKVLQYLDATKYRIKNGQIIINVIDLDCKVFRDRIEKAFSSESHNLLTIECRKMINEQFVNKFYGNLFDIALSNHNKKIILIINQNEHNILTEKFKSNLHNVTKRPPKVYTEDTDVINLKDFEPVDNPLKKQTIVFKGQKSKLSLDTLTGIKDWNNFIDYLYQANIQDNQDIIDIMMLVLTADEIEIGSKPIGTSSLDGAHVKMCEEINVKAFAKRLLLLGSDNSTDRANSTNSDNNNDVYIVKGIIGKRQKEKINKLIELLGQDSEKPWTVKDELQIVDDKFENENFIRNCELYPEKRVFWISVKCENNVSKFYLEQFYDPNFYLKRTFKIIEKVVISKEVKKLIMKYIPSEIFIFHCDKKDLIHCLDEYEIERLQRNGKIMLFTEEAVARATFEDLFRERRVETVHLLTVENKQIIWWDSLGTPNRLLEYIEEKKISLVQEDHVIDIIKDKKILIIADDPGMGKTTTLTKLYESNSIFETHWVIKINLKDRLKSVKDIELFDDVIDADNVVKFLLMFDCKLSHNLTKFLLRLAFDKTITFSKPLVLAFDGFDELLDVELRNKVISLFKFLKDETSVKFWITTRLQFKNILENELSNFAIEFNPLDDLQKSEYIKKYLKERLYLILDEEKYAELFSNIDEKEDSKNIQMYTSAFLCEMKSIFRGDIARFIGTPLQLSLMLGGSTSHLKNWIENDDSEILDFQYIGNDLYEIYENYVAMKYDIYLHKIGIREFSRQRREMIKLDQDHKDFAVSKILAVNPDDDFEQFKDIFLLVGIIKSQGTDLEFIHKTFEEFFASKEFFRWIKKVTETNKQEYLLKVILMKPDYELIRTFMNLQLQKLLEPVVKEKSLNELDKSMERYGNIIAHLLSEENSPLIDEIGTPLLIAVKENNISIARFLLNSLKGHPDALLKFLFATGKCSKGGYGEFKGTPLHQACTGDDVEVVRILLDAAADISNETVQEYLKCEANFKCNALDLAVKCSHNVEIFNQVFSRKNDKLNLILSGQNILRNPHIYEKETFFSLLLQEFELEKDSLKQLLLNGILDRVLDFTNSPNIIQKVISVAKSLDDNNETLKNFLLGNGSIIDFFAALVNGKINLVKIFLNAANDIDDDNHTLKQLLWLKINVEEYSLSNKIMPACFTIINMLLKSEFVEKYIKFNDQSHLLLNQLEENEGGTSLHVAAMGGNCDVIKLLLETASALGIEYLENFVSCVNGKGKNAIQVMIECGHEDIFKDSFEMLEEEKYQNIRTKVMEMFHNITLESRLYLAKQKFLTAVKEGDIESVKDILGKARTSNLSSNEIIRILLLANETGPYNTLHLACKRGYSGIIEQLLTYAMNLDDEGATLKELLTTPNWRGRIPFEAIKEGCTWKIRRVVRNLIREATNNNKKHVADILIENDKNYQERIKRNVLCCLLI